MHFVAASNNGYHVAFKAGVLYSKGLANLVNRIPGFKGLTVGTNVDVGIIVTRNSDESWALTIKAYADAGGKSYGGVLILDCLSWYMLLTGGCT